MLWKNSMKGDVTYKDIMGYIRDGETRVFVSSLKQTVRFRYICCFLYPRVFFVVKEGKYASKTKSTFCGGK